MNQEVDSKTEEETPPQSCRHRWRKTPKILLALTGSVATVKGPRLAVELADTLGCEVRVLLTRGATNFWGKAHSYDSCAWQALHHRPPSEGFHKNDKAEIRVIDWDDEWKEWGEMGDPVMHIELRDWADVLLIAPLSAHTLAKIAHGFCDDTLTCVLRAWDFGHGTRQGKPVLLAPAMNTAMWQHPLTKGQLETIKGFWNGSDQTSVSSSVDDNKQNSSPVNGVQIIEPEVKTLACGEIGIGAMASVPNILEAVEETLQSRQF